MNKTRCRTRLCDRVTVWVSANIARCATAIYGAATQNSLRRMLCPTGAESSKARTCTYPRQWQSSSSLHVRWGFGARYPHCHGARKRAESGLQSLHAGTHDGTRVGGKIGSCVTKRRFIANWHTPSTNWSAFSERVKASTSRPP